MAADVAIASHDDFEVCFPPTTDIHREWHQRAMHDLFWEFLAGILPDRVFWGLLATVVIGDALAIICSR